MATLTPIEESEKQFHVDNNFLHSITNDNQLMNPAPILNHSSASNAFQSNGSNESNLITQNKLSNVNNISFQYLIIIHVALFHFNLNRML